MILGTTYSYRQAKWLGLEPKESLQTICTWPFHSLRLGAYWDEIETLPGTYDFSRLREQLDTCLQSGKQVVLTIGVKSPRWPEFYFPTHVLPDLSSQQTQKKLLFFIQKTAQLAKKYPNVTHWQVENEPLDPSGPDNLVVPLSFLEQEIELLRSVYPLPLIVNLWGNDLSSRGNLQVAQKIADIVGLDLYYQQYITRILGKNIYRGPRDRPSSLEQMIVRSHKPTWIMELQAEPWERDDSTFRGKNPESFNRNKLQKNWDTVKSLPVEAIFFWGAEYWLWQQNLGNPEFVEWFKNL